MNFPSGFLLCRSALYLLCLLIALPVFADEINVPGDKDTIQGAIDAAADGDTILVEPREYQESLSLRNKKRITLRGVETARTILKPAEISKPILTLEGTSRILVKNFTFLEAESGISITGSTDFSISANVFHLGSSGTAITVSKDSDGDITNNTFYKNSVGVKRATTDTWVENNLFSINQTAISDSSTTTTNINYNGFHNNADDGALGTNRVTISDAAFVSVDKEDFHLTAEATDAIDKDASGDDLGAYGGANADTYPYPVAGLSVVSPTNDAVSYSLTLTWSDNTDYRVNGYNVYTYIEGAESAFNMAAGVDVGDITSHPLSGTVPVAAAPAAPQIATVTPRHQSLAIAWSATSSATAYELRYGIDSTAENILNIGNVTSHVLSGLSNGTTYKIRVHAIAQATLHAAVTAHDANGHESYSLSNEVTQVISPAYTSEASTEVTGMPEATVSYPLLPNEGCFIATAAYGHYSAPQVQALRDFRDRYLMKFSAGRAFVHWYYTHGPAGARVLNDYPVLKLPARIALYPLVLSALFFTQTLASIQLLAVLSLVLLSTIAVLRYRKRISCAGSARSP